ncbi:MAG: DNA-binding protein [Clostridiales bacterium]|nr:DNA-binding protein [Clostridiales bacterium]
MEAAKSPKRSTLNASLRREMQFLRVTDVMEILDVSRSYAYRIMREMNADLAAEGWQFIPGRVSAKRLMEKFYTGQSTKPKKQAQAGKDER